MKDDTVGQQSETKGKAYIRKKVYFCRKIHTVGGGSKRNAFIRTNNALLGINPNIHGFKTFYYGVGTLRR